LADPNTSFLAEFGSTKTIDLIPNGSNVSVTKENRLAYIYPISHYHLSKLIKQQSDVFFEGLPQMVDQKWLGYDFFLSPIVLSSVVFIFTFVGDADTVSSLFLSQ
jgi:hypothetical protein